MNKKRICKGRFTLIARQLIREWQDDYNHVRPHSSLKYETPINFALGKESQQQQDLSASLIRSPLPDSCFQPIAQIECCPRLSTARYKYFHLPLTLM